MKPTFVFWGKVIHGNHRGSKLGFPTANVPLHQKIPEGIFASLVSINNKQYLGATFIGGAKTFGEKDYKAEIYVLDFSQNIYGNWASVKLFKKIRDNKKFASEKDLIKKMKQDVSGVRDFFAS